MSDPLSSGLDAFYKAIHTRRKRRQRCRGPGGHLPACWPMRSEALAVHPEEREQAIADAKKAGVPTYFDRHGRPVFESAGHRKRYCEQFGYFDRNGGYGDPQRS